mmetsp:Transcript_4934/g.18578  ORF Transcript_4934/g.18578 Transcript_4934/m.18578 type:complete len:1442 (-) Transcript_4934:76-4401(-)|eukprot:CAMPEP_0117456328 /NCGR_PEP_ID=MMETSP0759-20121206/11820_1 /TAXON_ID=63605 /ORGANISM="Percolomonas cosmopolitus, Strain WS" /LENGTH=1441 /DNA_ID=CAMNT_0005249663 /DNA_START=392 /DNA_END=4717 /DNA_ORIENTATION=-
MFALSDGASSVSTTYDSFPREDNESSSKSTATSTRSTNRTGTNQAGGMSTSGILNADGNEEYEDSESGQTSEYGRNSFFGENRSSQGKRKSSENGSRQSNTVSDTESSVSGSPRGEGESVDEEPYTQGRTRTSGSSRKRKTTSVHHEKELLRREFKLIKNLFSRTITNDLIDRSEMKKALSMSDTGMGDATSLPTLQSDAANWSITNTIAGDSTPNLTTLDPSYNEEKLVANSKLDDYILQQIGRYRKYFSDGLKRKFDCWRVAALEKDRLLIAILKREESRVTSLAHCIAQCKLMEHNHREILHNLFDVAEKKNLTVQQLRQLYKRCIGIFEEGDLYKKFHEKPKKAPRTSASHNIIVNRRQESHQERKREGKKSVSNTTILTVDNTAPRSTYLDSFSPAPEKETHLKDHERIESSVEDDSSDTLREDKHASSILRYNFADTDESRLPRSEILGKYYDNGEKLTGAHELNEQHLIDHAENLKALAESYLRDFEETEKQCFAHFELLLEESNERVLNSLSVSDQHKETQVNLEGPDPHLSSSNDEVDAFDLFKKEYTNPQKEFEDIQKLLNIEHAQTDDLNKSFDAPPSNPMEDEELDIDRELNRLMEIQQRLESDSAKEDAKGRRKLSHPTLSRSFSVQSAISELSDLTDWNPHDLELETEFQQREKRLDQVDKLQLERQRILNEELTATNDRLMHEVDEYRNIAERSEQARKMLERELGNLKTTKFVDPNRVKHISQKLDAISGEEKLLNSSHKKKAEALRQQIEQVQKEKEELLRQIKVRQYRKRIYNSLTRLDSQRNLSLHPDGLNPSQIPRGIVGLIFTDIVQSTALWSAIPNVMEQCIYLHHSTIRGIIRQFKGSILEVKTEGDAVFAATSDCMAGVEFMLRVQMALLNAPWPEELLHHPHGREIKDENGTVIFRGLKLRMGMHYARAIMHMDKTTKRPDYYGSSVSIAARAETVAEPGCCAITPQVWEQIRDHLDEFHIPVTVKHIGKIALKGIPQSQIMRLVAPQQLSARVEQTTKKEVDLLIENKLFDLFSERNRLIKKTTDLQILLKKKTEQMQKLRAQTRINEEEKSSFKNQIKQLEDKNDTMRHDYEMIVQKVEKLKVEQKQIFRQQKTAQNRGNIMPMPNLDGTEDAMDLSSSTIHSTHVGNEKHKKNSDPISESTSVLLAEANSALREFNKSKTGWRMTLSKSLEAKKVHHLLPVGNATRVKPKVSQNDLEELLKKSVKQMEVLQKQFVAAQKERDTYKSSWSKMQRQLAMNAEESKFELLDLQKTIASSLQTFPRVGTGNSVQGASTSGAGEMGFMTDSRHHSYDNSNILSTRDSFSLMDTIRASTDTRAPSPKKGTHRSSLGNMRSVLLSPLDRGNSPQQRKSRSNSRTSDSGVSPPNTMTNGSNAATSGGFSGGGGTAGSGPTLNSYLSRSYDFASIRKLPKLR